MIHLPLCYVILISIIEIAARLVILRRVTHFEIEVDNFINLFREMDIRMNSLNRHSGNNDYEDINKYCSDIYAEVGEYATVAAMKAAFLEEEDDPNFSNYVPMAPAASISNIDHIGEMEGRDINHKKEETGEEESRKHEGDYATIKLQ